MLTDLLVEIYKNVETAKTNGKVRLPARRLAGYRRRYRHLLATGQTQNPPRTGRALPAR